MRFVFACLAIMAAGCADRFVTEGHALGNHVWFAEVRDPASGDDETRLIVCSASSSPPCVRLLPRDLRTVAQFKAWLATAQAEAATAGQTRGAEPAPIDAHPASVAPSQSGLPQPAP